MWDLKWLELLGKNDRKIIVLLQDVTDFEWEFWTRAVKSLRPAMLVHTIGGLVCSRFLPQVRSLLYRSFYSQKGQYRIRETVEELHTKRFLIALISRKTVVSQEERRFRRVPKEQGT